MPQRTPTRTPKIAVEDGLSPLNQYLSSKGYQVISWDGEASANVDILVLTGMDDNLMGDQTIRMKVPVILAEGRTPEQVEQEIQRRVR